MRAAAADEAAADWTPHLPLASALHCRGACSPATLELALKSERPVAAVGAGVAARRSIPLRCSIVRRERRASCGCNTRRRNSRAALPQEHAGEEG